VATCLECHSVAAGTLEGVPWAGTAHARTYLVLETGYEAMVPPEAQKLVPLGAGRQIRQEAARLGSETGCVSCHGGAPMAEVLPLDDTFHVEDGVQCETCHGPGSLHVRSRREGFHEADSLSIGAAVRARLCDRCHREKPSHRVLGTSAFAAEKAWQSIRHALPEGT